MRMKNIHCCVDIKTQIYFYLLSFLPCIVRLDTFITFTEFNSLHLSINTVSQTDSSSANLKGSSFIGFNDYCHDIFRYFGNAYLLTYIGLNLCSKDFYT